MSSRVHFRFSSSTDYDFVLFNGEFITVGELKYLISKKTGVLKDRNTVVELFDSRTEEEYADVNTMIAKNSSVIAKRSPAVKAPIISTVPTKTPPPVPESSTREVEAGSKETPVDDEFGPDAFAPDMKPLEDVGDDEAINELVKGFGEVWRTDLNAPSAWRGGRGGRCREGGRGGGGRKPFLKMGRPNLPPFGYICHRCNIPGHFIDECPTNGDPAYDFVRVRYPTGIPSTMLVKDDQGGLLMPNGERARLRPNTEKFKQEMEGVPGGDVSRLLTEKEDNGKILPVLDNKQFEELSAMLCNNPLSSITPLVMNVLPQGRDVDLHKGFFNGSPLDQEAFLRCKEDFNRAKALFEENSRPNSPSKSSSTKLKKTHVPNGPPTSNPGGNGKPLLPNEGVGGPPLYDRRETREWNRSYDGYHPPPQKPMYPTERFYDPNLIEHPPVWSGGVHPPVYETFYSQPRRPPPYLPEYPHPRMQESLQPPVRSSPLLYEYPTTLTGDPSGQRSLVSEAVRIHPPGPRSVEGIQGRFVEQRPYLEEEAREKLRHRSSRVGNSPSPLLEPSQPVEESPKNLPYGFGSLQEEKREQQTSSKGGSAGDHHHYRGSRSRSRSYSHREESNRANVRNDDKEGLESIQRRSKRKHEGHRRKSRKKKSSPDDLIQKNSSASKQDEVLDRWKLVEPLPGEEADLKPDSYPSDNERSHKKRRSEKKSVRDSHGKEQRSRNGQREKVI